MTEVAERVRSRNFREGEGRREGEKAIITVIATDLTVVWPKPKSRERKK